VERRLVETRPLPTHTKNARPATIWIRDVGKARAKSDPTSRDPAWSSRVASVTARSTVQARWRVANAIAMSWLLSPSSARKITPNERRNACIRTPLCGVGSDENAFDPTPWARCR
jgi:hypothetical protein